MWGWKDPRSPGSIHPGNLDEGSAEMCLSLLRGVAFIAAAALLVPPPGFAQRAPPPVEQSPDAAASNNAEQLDALLAQIALYPDALLTQVLMASTYPLQVVDASRWLARGNNKTLSGDALAQALTTQNWDPSVKSLAPFPQVLEMLNSNLDWTQQLGYAFANQQNDVWNSIQRLRVQAQTAGQLKTTEQQTVAVEDGAIVIQPANPQVVYVPAYNPSVVYGTWPYPSYPPAYYPPPPGYVVGSALASGLAFAAGVAIVGSLWGWCGPRWSGGYGNWGGSVNVNANRYNNINVNRPPLSQGGWRPPPAGGPGGRPGRPPGGPVGPAGRPAQLPANAIGRPNVQVPGNLARPQPQPGRPGGSAGGRPTPGGPVAGGNPSRPGAAPGGGPIQSRPGAPQQRPAGGMNRPAGPSQQPGGAFGGMNNGGSAGQFGQRGAQSRGFQQQQSRSFQQPRGGGGAPRAAPQQRGGGGGAARGGGGGGGRGGRR
jgi:hypothetical protein